MEIAFEVLVSAAIPLAFFLLNWRFRVRSKYALSAASDFALAICAFDVAALAAGDVFKAAMHATLFRKEYTSLFVILFLASMALWCTFFLSFEDSLLRIANRPVSRYHEIPLRFFSVWVVAVVMFSAHVFVFVY